DDGSSRRANRPRRVGRRLGLQELRPQRLPARHRPGGPEWFPALGCLRATSPRGYGFVSAGDWLNLDDVLPRPFWRHLADAADLGIELVAKSKRDTVRVAREASVALDLSLPDGGARLERTVAFDGVTTRATTVGTLGRHGLFAVEESPSGRTVVLG